MENSKKAGSKFERAQHRVALIRGFYNHLVIFLIINAVLFFFKEKLMAIFVGDVAYTNPDVTSWVNWNLIVWLIILVLHAIIIFGKIPFLGKKWEERQIQKYMEEDNS